MEWHELHTKQGSTAIILATFFTLIIVGAGIYYLGSHNKLPELGTAQHITSPINQGPQNATDSAMSDPSTWKSHTISDIKLTFSAPPDMEVTSDTQKDTKANPDALTLYVERGTAMESSYYQLYGIYQWGEQYDKEALTAFKGDLDPSSIEEKTVAGFPAISGQVKGERNRLVTAILTSDGMFKLLTSEPTAANKKITDQILATFSFTK